MSSPPGRAGPGAPTVAGGSRRATARLRQTPVFFIAFLLLMGIAWVVANPPGYAPDEPAHYTKAIAVGRGQWVGRPGAYPVGPGFGPLQLQWINKATRTVDMPPKMAPYNFACSVFNPRSTASCLDALPPNETRTPFLTYVGSYEPFVYLPPGLLMTLSEDADTALLLGRAVIAVISLGLLATAARVLVVREAGVRSLVGLVVATTPMVIFLTAELAPVGTEIAAATCFTAVVLRLARHEMAPRWVWVVAGVSGAILAVSRSLGPFFVVALVGLFTMAAGPRGALRTLRRGGGWALAAGTSVAVGVAANAAWGVAVQPHPSPSIRSVLSLVSPSAKEVPEVLRQTIGSFGWQDVNMPRVAYLAWAALLGALVALAFIVGRQRQRLLLAATITGCFVGTVALAAAVIHQTNFPMYGRYVLPMWVTVPLVAGEIVVLNSHGVASRALASLTVVGAVVAAAVHATAWYVNGRRYAVSDFGPVLWPGDSAWQPLGGWLPWFVVTGLAVACLLVHGALAITETSGPARLGAVGERPLPPLASG